MSNYLELARATSDANREVIATLDDLHNDLHLQKDAGQRPLRHDLAARKVNRARQMIDNGHRLAQTYALIAIAENLERLTLAVDVGLSLEELRNLTINAGDRIV